MAEQTFPAVDVAAELYPGINTQVQVDPASSEVAAYKEIKEQDGAKQKKKKKKENKDTLQTIKSAIIISGIVVAVAGAALVITKKLKEK